ncbi:hypothetical protein SEA_TOMAS_247 [Streptomyces phage Tomas]|uniref:Uncharacterized protein n=1 Tax=Streptomyces phage Tomas TaxID=2914443 RepID=A0AA49BT68_9CAUD|nr:hypothetical protein PP453_gp077 [Streptomyces phage Tomas]UMO76390.1 hypothetical protein SEA_TOMAS_247 [Streptomyces phage Tomas]
MDEFAREVKAIFDAKGYKWRVDGKLKKPTLKDITETLEDIKEKMKDNGVGTWIYLGRFIVVKEANGLLDVFVHQGTIEEDTQELTKD